MIAIALMYFTTIPSLYLTAQAPAEKLRLFTSKATFTPVLSDRFNVLHNSDACFTRKRTQIHGKFLV